MGRFFDGLFVHVGPLPGDAALDDVVRSVESWVGRGPFEPFPPEDLSISAHRMFSLRRTGSWMVVDSSEDRRDLAFAEFLSVDADRPVVSARLIDSSILRVVLLVQGETVDQASCNIDPPEPEEDVPPSAGEWRLVLPDGDDLGALRAVWEASAESSELRLNKTMAALRIDLRVANPPLFGTWTDPAWHQMTFRATGDDGWFSGERNSRFTPRQTVFPLRLEGPVGLELLTYGTKTLPELPHREFVHFYSVGEKGVGVAAWVGGSAVTTGLLTDLGVGLAADHLRVRVTGPLVRSGDEELPLMATFDDFPIAPGIQDPDVFWRRALDSTEVDVLESARIRFLLDGRLSAVGSGELIVALAPLQDTSGGARIAAPVVIA